MSHSEGHWETRVLTDAAAAVGLTHARHVGQTQSVTGHVDGCTDVLPVKSQTSVDHNPTEEAPSHAAYTHDYWNIYIYFFM